MTENVKEEYEIDDASDDEHSDASRRPHQLRGAEAQAVAEAADTQERLEGQRGGATIQRSLAPADVCVSLSLSPTLSPCLSLSLSLALSPLFIFPTFYNVLSFFLQ